MNYQSPAVPVWTKNSLNFLGLATPPPQVFEPQSAPTPAPVSTPKEGCGCGCGGGCAENVQKPQDVLGSSLFTDGSAAFDALHLKVAAGLIVALLLAALFQPK